MSFIVGGPKAWKVYRKGDIGISFHWVNGEPAMVLFPANRASSKSVIPFAIPLGVAWQYANSDGHPNLVHTLAAATDAARCLGMAPDLGTIHRIVDAIVDGIPDLVTMPPEPISHDTAPKLDGELSIKRDGETVIEVPV